RRPLRRVRSRRRRNCWMTIASSPSGRSSTMRADRAWRAASVVSSLMRAGASASGTRAIVWTSSRMPAWTISAGSSNGSSAARAGAGLADGAVEGVGQQAAGPGDALGEAGGALLAQERVGVMAGRQQRDLHAQGAAGLEGAGAVHAPGQAAARGLQQFLGAL